MELFTVVGKFFWLVCLLFQGISYLMARARLERRAEQDGVDVASACYYTRLFAFCGALPWLVMGAGILTGASNSVWDYFRPQDGNPAVIAWIGSALVLSIAFAFWAMFGDGARKVVQYQLLRTVGMHGVDQLPESFIKLLAALAPVVILVWVMMVSMMDLPSPSALDPGLAATAPAVGAAPLGGIGPDGYRVAFDLDQAGFKDWKFPGFGLIFVSIGIVVFINRERLSYGRRQPAWMRKIFPYVFLGFAVLWTTFAFIGTYGSYRHLRHALDNGEAETVEGPVTHFQPMPVAGHAQEHFCVQDKCFSYSDYIINSGFNNTSSHGGPVHQGASVRVTYVDRVIVKLEVKN